MNVAEIRRHYKPSARITDVHREAALRAALRSLPTEHHGSAHLPGQPFLYKPNLCPGCVHSVVGAMLRDLVEGKE